MPAATAAGVLDRPLCDFPPVLYVRGLSAGAAEANGTYLRSTDIALGAPLYYHTQESGIHRPRRVLSRAPCPVPEGLTRIRGSADVHMPWSLRSSLIVVCSAVGWPPAELPQDVRCWTNKGGALPDVRVTAHQLLRVGQMELGAEAVGLPLSEVGLSAEGAAEVMGRPPAGLVPAAEGPLTIYVRAPMLGRPEAVALEVSPDATVGGLLALFARDYLGSPDA
eukprot:TRINITY_DN36490_c0_g1_i1.p1 TRINITY_DN36490_c0_g1~~TRINITY_DN36490_c0_g1_i1.p1  ORF type:complete len:251 (+),score=45.77 TRINITY_DN36490_c0_g1_i1:88-753(+)